MNIICWNCRGAGGKSFHSLIRDMRKEYDAHFIILLETHVSGMKGKKIRDKMGFDGSFIVEAVGHSGGIWCLWDAGIWDVVVLDYSHQLVHLQVSCNNSDSWLLSACYGSPQRATRRSLWSNIRSLADNTILPWCLLGDFNAILHDHERQGDSSRVISGACNEIIGWPFTWKRGNLVERLDRGLSNLNWQLKFPEAYLKHLPLLKSDHSPICLKFAADPSPNRGKRPFRFLAAWLSHPNFNDWLPEDMVKKIAAISPPSPWKMPDHVAWNFSNLQDWVSSNLSTSRNWQCLFGVVTSSLWFFRNKLIFEGNSTTVASAIAQIRVRFDEFNRSSRSKVHLNAPYANHARLISWKPPSEDAVKLNVDGSYMAITNNAACGGILRNYLGGFIKGFSCNLGSCSIMHAELWGIVHGLRIATSLNLSCVIVESDSASALKFITQSYPTTHSCSSLIEEIKLQANRIPHVYWNNVPREANSVADQLAKKGQHLPLGLHTFDSAPCEISHIIASDIASVPLFRGI
ncbi:hypothetical protein Ahy_B02g058063 [Arachis hypogaea]|uniref:Uncharacterized protein n=1 Tax=Arachis hypogaea TaxID=3818 RepID=A0A445ADQ9_ARAHY|nr:hypothetical protein Ahy_B02g058063 [Arachis hypogaea]